MKTKLKIVYGAQEAEVQRGRGAEGKNLLQFLLCFAASPVPDFP